jgi:hypothetical protein
MKKYLVATLALVMLTLFTACGSSDGTKTGESEKSAKQEENTVPEADPKAPIAVRAKTGNGFAVVVLDDGSVYAGKVGQTLADLEANNDSGMNLSTNIADIGIEIEVVPADGKAYSDDGVDADGQWKMNVIKSSVPDWFDEELQGKVWDAFELWRQEAFK